MKMSTKAAVAYVINNRGVTRYRLAQLLEIAPINITRYLRGGKMSASTAQRFEDLFSITITDYKRPKPA